MVLYSELKGYKVVNQLGKELGKINELIVDLSDWEIKNIILTHGLRRKHVSHKLESLKSADEANKKLIIPSDSPEEEVPETSSLEAAFVKDDLLGKKVVSSDHQDVGKVYDFDVPLSLKHWKIWKVLIKRGLKERRLRIGPDEILSVEKDVVLKKSLSELEGEHD
jgi:sporulation protein YlmC with PRC-barrel domain